MAILALNAAATGLNALSTRIDVTANNLANAETPAFKKSRANFEDLMYLKLRQPGAVNADGDRTPAGLLVGLGVKVSNTQINFEQGSLETTNQPYDVAIEGTGFFKVKIVDGVGGGEAFTRAGNFFRNPDGDLVLGNGDGYRLIPNINVPPDTTDLSISTDGRVSARRAGGLAFQEVGRITLSRFVNPQGLDQLGGNLYLPTDASGPPLESDPGQDGSGQLRQGLLEGSNVDPVRELVGLIKTQRAFELNSQSIQTANQALQTIGQLGVR